MRSLITTLLLIFTISISGQTSNVHLENGITKHGNQDFKGAIKDYSSAIKEDKENKEAYYNRGTCQLALKDYNSAMSDFDKTIKLDQKKVVNL